MKTTGSMMVAAMLRTAIPGDRTIIAQAMEAGAVEIEHLTLALTASEKRVQELEYARDNPPPRHGRGCLCGKCVWDGR